MEISALKTPPVQPTQSNKRTEEARMAQTEAANAKAQEVKKTQEAPPKPVVNTQGQTIGGRLNVTAWPAVSDISAAMVAISATNSATSSVQQSLNQTRLQQARRVADQAEANAQDLRQQADSAELQAQKSQSLVRDELARSQQTGGTYESQIKAGKSVVPPTTQDFLVGLYDSTREKRAANGNALRTDSSASSVLNAQGQATGRIVNLSA